MGDSQLSKVREALTCLKQELHGKNSESNVEKEGLQHWGCDVVGELHHRKSQSFFFNLTHVVSLLILSFPSKPGQCKLYASVHVPLKQSCRCH